MLAMIHDASAFAHRSKSMCKFLLTKSHLSIIKQQEHLSLSEMEVAPEIKLASLPVEPFPKTAVLK
jgi:hypothetical protein